MGEVPEAMAKAGEEMARGVVARGVAVAKAASKAA